MREIEQHLRRIIARDGPISVARFMAEALGHPTHGYYARGDPFGRAGDFITAPEVSQMFGELIGLWCAHSWGQMDRPPRFVLVELGPGRGTLLADALRAARIEPEFLRAALLHLVETSPALKAKQRESLADIPVVWHDDIAGVPDGPLIAIANEFFDALPIRQFERTERGWRERLVTLDESRDSFAFTLAQAPPPEVPAAGRRGKGGIAEVSPAAIELARVLGARVARDGGAALIIDYGEIEGGAGDTLQAVRRHRPWPRLARPGSADLTAHVDFAALARAAREAGAAVHGPRPQGEFLRALGIEERARRLLAGASDAQAREIRSALVRLIDERRMGGLFKVLCLAHPELPTPAGYEDWP